MDNNSSSSSESIDFGGRFCRQFYHWTNVGFADVNNNNSNSSNLNITNNSFSKHDNSFTTSLNSPSDHSPSSSNTNHTDINFNTDCARAHANDSNRLDRTSINQLRLTSNSLDSSGDLTKAKDHCTPSTPKDCAVALLSDGLSKMKLFSTPTELVNRQQRSNSLFSSSRSFTVSPWSSSELMSPDKERVENVQHALVNRTSILPPESFTWEGTPQTQTQTQTRQVKNPAEMYRRNQRSSSLFSCSPNLIMSPWSSSETISPTIVSNDVIERRALMHKTAASFSEPRYTWSGTLPTKSYKNPVYSCKVFLGGVPWDVTEHGLIETFGRFGTVRVQWPGKDGSSYGSTNGSLSQGSHTKVGHVYLIYDSERYVKSLLASCTQDFGSGTGPKRYFFKLSSKRMRFKGVQVIPWIMADSNYVRCQIPKLDTDKTIFVGALHGMLTAEGLAQIMNDLFGGVAFVGIDTDKHKYPTGSGRVTFNNPRSYMKAIAAAFVEVKTALFCKKIQMDPYLGQSDCSVCQVQGGPVFCRDCLRYFCKSCWSWHHSSDLMGQHRPMIRKKRDRNE